MLLFQLVWILSFPQSLRYPVSTPYISLGAYSRQQADVFSCMSNQAALASVNSILIGIYGERRYMLSETSLYSLAAAMPTSLGNFGLQVNYAGFKNFNENKIGIAYGRTLGRRINIGVQFNYYAYHIPAYAAASTLNFEAGIIARFSETLSAGIQVYNPVGGKLGKTKHEKLAAAYKIGVGYDASENFFVSAEIIKEEDKPVNVVAGIQYCFKDQFFARAGFTGVTGSVFAGAGILWMGLRLDVSADYHPRLGFSPGVLIITNFKKKK